MASCFERALATSSDAYCFGDCLLKVVCPSNAVKAGCDSLLDAQQYLLDVSLNVDMDDETRALSEIQLAAIVKRTAALRRLFSIPSSSLNDSIAKSKALIRLNFTLEPGDVELSRIAIELLEEISLNF